MKNARNIKVKSEEEIKSLDDKYEVIDCETYVVISVKTKNLKLAYSVKENFDVNIEINNKNLKMRITSNTIKYWQRHKEYSLFKVQNVINYLISSHQEVNEENIEREIKNGNRIKAKNDE